jgi:hypothetical protein
VASIVSVQMFRPCICGSGWVTACVMQAVSAGLSLPSCALAGVLNATTPTATVAMHLMLTLSPEAGQCTTECHRACPHF